MSPRFDPLVRPYHRVEYLVTGYGSRSFLHVLERPIKYLPIRMAIAIMARVSIFIKKMKQESHSCGAKSYCSIYTVGC